MNLSQGLGRWHPGRAHEVEDSQEGTGPSHTHSRAALSLECAARKESHVHQAAPTSHPLPAHMAFSVLWALHFFERNPGIDIYTAFGCLCYKRQFVQYTHLNHAAATVILASRPFFDIH